MTSKPMRANNSPKMTLNSDLASSISGGLRVKDTPILSFVQCWN